MDAFAWALMGFIALHVGVSAAGLRAGLVRALGEGPYRGLFALVSLLLFAVLVWAFGRMRADLGDPLNAPLWSPPAWTRHLTYLLVMFGFLFAIAGLLSPGATTAGMEGRLQGEAPARGMMRITRHPFLWGVAFWAAGHLIVNGERFALMLFGGIGAMVLLGARSIDRKLRARDPEGFARFEAVTSNIPFAAIVQGRNKFALGEIWLPLLIALVAYGVFGVFHRQIIGVPAFILP